MNFSALPLVWPHGRRAPIIQARLPVWSLDMGRKPIVIRLAANETEQAASGWAGAARLADPC